MAHILPSEVQTPIVAADRIGRSCLNRTVRSLYSFMMRMYVAIQLLPETLFNDFTKQVIEPRSYAPAVIKTVCSDSSLWFYDHCVVDNNGLEGLLQQQKYALGIDFIFQPTKWQLY